MIALQQFVECNSLKIIRFCRFIFPPSNGTIIFLGMQGRTKITDMNTAAKVITGFLIGTMLGTLTGLLMAPATGKKTRKNIEKKTKKLVKQVASQVGLGEKARKAPHTKNGKAPVQAN
jgi:hypothetical protein